MILAPLRGVTIRCFRETFAAELSEGGFREAITPFVPAMAGLDPLKDRELIASDHQRSVSEGTASCCMRPKIRVTPQFIGKDPLAFRKALLRIRDVGYATADLNCGCPFPMVRNKGRGSGILRRPDVLRQMVEVGCETMGPGNFSIKARLGVERSDELLKLMPMLNAYPLRFLTVHARTARQMYDGPCDRRSFEAIRSVAEMRVIYNGDVAWPVQGSASDLMVGRSFIRALGARTDSDALLVRYIASSQAELSGDRPVLGRLKELVSYWKELPRWHRRWNVLKIARTLSEFSSVLQP